MTYLIVLGGDAEDDIVGILEWSVNHFGSSVRDGYLALIEAVLARIADDPELPGSRDRDDLGLGLRTVHLRTGRDEVSPAVRRIANPRHFVVYRQVDEVIEVVRLLHDAMHIPARRILE
ncbi:type II toxin-antitoxin system RelE/ParE family toxin [Gulosibacter sp. 10]|uniref:type II toxin-antitoxin system RelE/ParE family toxin n=1 Tax=Gulosibacter sp. 10 TaxID=1255570 RepID=UPI00097EB387|nr:type II toxin-antitoxin system RelE/ParE family toxin [Gulosibacter sp. 10]SJM68982.1 hypothetical protein FM112_13810 [Gulosibacter sp. 10]